MQQLLKFALMAWKIIFPILITFTNLPPCISSIIRSWVAFFNGVVWGFGVSIIGVSVSNNSSGRFCSMCLSGDVWCD